MSRKAGEGRIIQTCSCLAAPLALLIAVPVAASTPPLSLDPAQVYVTARAAAIDGNHEEAAQLLAELAGTSNDVAQQAVEEAISAGNMPLAIQLITRSPETASSVEARILLVADALRGGHSDAAEQWLVSNQGGANLSFWLPLVEAWAHADRGDASGALTTLAGVPKNSAMSPFVDEESALILLKLGHAAEAEPYARRAIDSAGPREFRLRLALAAGFQAAGDHTLALAMLDGINADPAPIRAELQAGKLKPALIDTVAKAFSEQLLALAIEMRRSHNGPGDPADIVRIARYAAPDNSEAAILLGAILDDEGQTDQALAVLQSVPDSDPLKSNALDAESRALTGDKRYGEALALAQAAVRAPDAAADDFARLGDVYSAMKRYNEAADAYGKAIDLSAGAEKGRIWPMLLLRASALDSANRWPEAKQVLGAALAMAPDQPLILNYLGYADLVHGQDLDTAEALIRKANELDPDDASITDSLGWALFKKGQTDHAIDVLQQAAANDPTQAEIQEHLGDALYTAGYKFRARYAWRAALATADDDAQARLKAKIEGGLTQATAAR